MRLVWSPRALRQLEQTLDFIGQEDPAAAWAVYERITDKVRKLLDFPAMGREGRVAGTRELVITGLPYVVVYRVSAQAVEVAALWHSAQNRKP